MENKLKKLFDYQTFEQNKELQKIIDEALDFETSFSLSDDMLGAVAGGAIIKPDKQQEDKEKKDKEIKDN